MQNVLKYTTAFLIAIIMLVSYVGINLNKVYCFHKQQYEYSITYLSLDNSCSCTDHKQVEKKSCCKSKKSTPKKKCCENETERIIIESDYDVIVSDYSVTPTVKFIIADYAPLSTLLDVDNNLTKNYLNLKPPLINERDIPILIQSFLL